MAPVNFLFTNSEVAKRAFETGGASLVEGARNLLSDVQDGSLSMVDAEAFEVGIIGHYKGRLPLFNESPRRGLLGNSRA